jgi:CelD/BcsL family acetyltransferase involved in cellulose biosynthesis
VRLHPLSDSGLAASWDEFATELRAGPFLRPGWFAAWADAFAPGPVEVAVEGSDSPEALIPLVRAPKRVTAPVNEEAPEFGALAGRESAAVHLFEQLLGAGPDVVELLKVDGGTANALRSASEAAGYRVATEIMQHSPWLDIAGDWNAYESSLSATFRQGIRRKRRRLEDGGEVTIDVETGARDLDRRLREGFAVESSRWKGELGTAIASNPAAASFYTAIAHWAAERGWLRLVFLRVDGAAIAFRFDLVVDHTYYHVKGGYDPAYARFSPGLILQHETVRQAFETGLSRYEFLGADEPYKLNWTKTRRERHAIRAFAPTLRGRLGWAARSYGAPAVRRLRALRSRQS